MAPSLSLSLLSWHCGKLTMLNSSLSCLLKHPGSLGKSVSPSPSLSLPSWHAALGFVSSVSPGPEQLKSAGKSATPSPSLSMPSLHCAIGAELELACPQMYASGGLGALAGKNVRRYPVVWLEVPRKATFT